MENRLGENTYLLFQMKTGTEYFIRHDYCAVVQTADKSVSVMSVDAPYEKFVERPLRHVAAIFTATLPTATMSYRLILRTAAA